MTSLYWITCYLLYVWWIRALYAHILHICKYKFRACIFVRILSMRALCTWYHCVHCTRTSTFTPTSSSTGSSTSPSSFIGVSPLIPGGGGQRVPRWVLHLRSLSLVDYGGRRDEAKVVQSAPSSGSVVSVNTDSTFLCPCDGGKSVLGSDRFYF